ncbi:MAG: HEPN domain-containing protein [Chloroflexi bacterium]|nr:HEPN domain-containing protein [Chloroflexota bacterium]
MPTSLARSELALTISRTHLGSTNTQGSAVESYLTRYLAVVICAEVEETVAEPIAAHIARSANQHIASFLNNVKRRTNYVANAKYSEIRKILNYFDQSYGDQFAELVRLSVDDRGLQALGNLVGLRNEVAHTSPPPVTFDEAELALDTAASVVAAVEAVLASK